MTRKKQTSQDKKTNRDFHTRFMEVLCTKPVAWWSEELDVVPSLINARWKKGSFPNADNLIKICRLAGISANWLLLGEGPKHLETKAMDEETRRKLQNYIATLEYQNEEIREQSKKIVSDAEILNVLKWFSETFQTDAEKGWAEQLETLTGNEIFNRILTPNYILVKMLFDMLFKSMEQCADSPDGREQITAFLSWIMNNYDKNVKQVKGNMKNLDSLFEKIKDAT